MHLMSMIVAAAMANAVPVVDTPPTAPDRAAVGVFVHGTDPELTVSSGVHTIQFKEIARHPPLWESNRFVDDRLVEGATRRWEFVLTHAAVNENGDYAVAGESSDDDLKERLRLAVVVHEPDDAEHRAKFDLPPRGPDVVNWRIEIQQHHDLHAFVDPPQHYPQTQDIAFVAGDQVLAVALEHQSHASEDGWIEVRPISAITGALVSPPVVIVPPGPLPSVTLRPLPGVSAFAVVTESHAPWEQQCETRRIEARVVDQRGQTLWMNATDREPPEPAGRERPEGLDSVIAWTSRVHSPHQVDCSVAVDGTPLWEFKIKEWDGKAVVEPR